jgi:hypothetical protein
METRKKASHFNAVACIATELAAAGRMRCEALLFYTIRRSDMIVLLAMFRTEL